MTDEQQIAALREGIRRAGRNATRAAVVCGCLALAVLFGFGIGVLGGLAFSALAGLGVVLLLPLPGIRLWRIRRAMRRLSPQDQTDVLVPLLTGPGEKYPTRELAGSLRLEMRHSAELTPSVAPDTCGNEASPAENER